MANKYEYKYPRPSVTADAVVFGWENRRLHILLIQRGHDPFKGCWAFPGGFMDMNETVEECAVRELKEETGMDVPTLKQFHCFSAVDRDPRGRTLSVGCMALVNKSDYTPTAGDDAGMAQWFDLNNIPFLAFDHEDIIDIAKKYLLLSLDSSSIVATLLPEKFTIKEYYDICRKLYKRLGASNVMVSIESFEERVKSLGIVSAISPLSQVTDKEKDGETAVKVGPSDVLFSFAK